jgi:hypothetical protein
MRELGFECFLLDVTEAPDAILRALCQHAYIHTVVNFDSFFSNKVINDRTHSLSFIANY